MVMLRHPLSGAEYRRNEDGTVLVTGGKGGAGVFTRKGVWISGQRKTADPALCLWVADGEPNIQSDAGRIGARTVAEARPDDDGKLPWEPMR